MASVAESAPSCQAPNKRSTPPALLDRLQGVEAIALPDLLFATPHLARPLLMACLDLDARSADFLLACVSWTLAWGGPFFKFNLPCAHPWYRPGDSWAEELGCGEEALLQARARVATKNVTGSSLTETLASPSLSSLVLYWTSRDRTTWYEANLPLLCAKLSERLGIMVYVVAGNPNPPPGISAPPSKFTLPLALATAAQPNEPAPEPPAAPTLLPPAATLSLANPDMPSLSSSPPITAPPPARSVGAAETPRPARNPGTATVTYDLSQEEVRADPRENLPHLTLTRRLMALGVYDDPARAIAERALSAGLNPTQTLAIFRAHLAQLEATKSPEEARSIAVWRMRHRPLQPPPDARPRSPVHARYYAEREAAADRAHPRRASIPQPEAAADKPRLATTPQVEVAPFASPACVAATLAPQESAAPALVSPTPDEVMSCPANPPDEVMSCPAIPPEATLWRAVLDEMQRQTTRAVFESWLRHTSLVEIVGDIYTIAAPTSQAAEWLAHRLNHLLTRALAAQVGQPVTLHFTVAAQEHPA